METLETLETLNPLNPPIPETSGIKPMTDPFKTIGEKHEELNPILPVLKKSLISSNETSDKFMIDHPELIDWTLACKYQKLSENVIRQCAKYINWKIAAQTQIIPSDVIDENMHRMNWDDIQKYQVISIDIIRKYWDILDVELLLVFQKYGTDVLEFILSKIDEIDKRKCIDLMTKEQILDDVFIYKHQTYLDMNLLVKWQKLTTQFIQTNWDSIDKSALVRYQTLSPDIIRKRYKSFNSHDLIQYQEIPIDVIMDDPSQFPVKMVCQYQQPNAQYIRAHGNDIDWDILKKRVYAPCYLRLQPLKLYDELQDIIFTRINWIQISDLPLDEQFIGKYSSDLNMIRVLKTCKLSEMFVTRTKLNPIERWVVYIFQTTLSPKWRKEHNHWLEWWNQPDSRSAYENMSSESKNEFVTLFSSRIKWNIFLKNKILPEWVLEIFIEHLNWYWVSRRQILSITFIQKHIDKMDSSFVCEYQTLTEQFLFDNRDILMWDIVCIYQNIPVSLARQIPAYIDSDAIRHNKKMTSQAIEEVLSIITSNT